MIASTQTAVGVPWGVLEQAKGRMMTQDVQSWWGIWKCDWGIPYMRLHNIKRYMSTRVSVLFDSRDFCKRPSNQCKSTIVHTCHSTIWCCKSARHVEMLNYMLKDWPRAITGTLANAYTTNKWLQFRSKHTQRGTLSVRTACDVAEAHVWCMSGKWSYVIGFIKLVDFDLEPRWQAEPSSLKP